VHPHHPIAVQRIENDLDALDDAARNRADRIGNV